MKASWRMVVVALLLVTSSTRCTTMDAPEAAAKVSFSEWAVNIRMPYRNETFDTIGTTGNLATVRVMVELKIDGKWTEKQTEVHCEKVNDAWECDRAMKFK